MPKVAEFFADLLVNSHGGEASVENLTSAFASLDFATVAEIGSLATLGVQLSKIVDQALSAAASFQMFETQTGVSAQALQRWQIAAAQANVSAETVAASIAGLTRNLANIRMGKGNIAPFALLGIGANQNPLVVLDQLRQRLKGVNSAVATNIIAEMGLDPAMLQVLRLSNDEFGKFAANAHGMTADQEKYFLHLKLQMNQASLALKDVGYALAEFLGPAIQRGFEDFSTLVTGPHGLIAGLKEFPAVAQSIGVVLAGMVAWVSHTTLALGLLLAVLDDLAAYKRGQDSITGGAIKGVKDIYSGGIGGFTDIIDQLTGGRPGHGYRPAGIDAPSVLLPEGMKGKNVTVNNNVNVTSTASARELAEELTRRLSEQNDRASQMIDNGELNP